MTEPQAIRAVSEARNWSRADLDSAVMRDRPPGWTYELWLRYWLEKQPEFVPPWEEVAYQQ
jgi:hypothetical protein